MALLFSVCAHAELVSPDGRWAIIESASKQGNELWLRNKQDNTTQRLIRLPGINRHAAWSPDSLFIAFCAQFNSRQFITVSDRTGHSWAVAEINGDCTTPAWSNDAQWLAFSAQTRNGDRDIFIATAGGSAHQNITTSIGKNEINPRWGLNAQYVDVEQNGVIVRIAVH